MAVEVLSRAGVRRFYTVPGESFLEVIDAVERHPALELVSPRHESGASFMAEADAKLTGVPAVAQGRTSPIPPSRRPVGSAALQRPTAAGSRTVQGPTKVGSVRRSTPRHGLIFAASLSFRLRMSRTRSGWRYHILTSSGAVRSSCGGSIPLDAYGAAYAFSLIAASICDMTLGGMIVMLCSFRAWASAFANTSSASFPTITVSHPGIRSAHFNTFAIGTSSVGGSMGV